MKMKHILSIVIFLIAALAFGNSDTIGKAKQAIYIDSDGFSEAKAYKMLYDNQVKSNDAILKTIYYALGGLATAMLLVFASNWWFNDKKVKDLVNEIDGKIKDAGKSNLVELTEKINSFSVEKTAELNQTQIKLQEKITNSIADISSKFNELSEKIRIDVKDDSKSLATTYQELLKSYNENLIQQIKSIKELNDERIKVLAKKIDDYEKTYEERLKKESKQLKRDILEHHAEIYFLKGLYNNALKAYLDFALFEFEEEYSWHFEYIKDNIIECLEKVDGIYDDELKSLNTLVEISINQYPEPTAKIISLFKDKPIKHLKSE